MRFMDYGNCRITRTICITHQHKYAEPGAQKWENYRRETHWNSFRSLSKIVPRTSY